MGQWRQANTNKQRYPRVATAVPVRITTVDPESDPMTGHPFFRSAEETTANLSRGGAYLRSWEPLAAGRRVIVAIDLPSGDELQLTARVVWTRRQLRPAKGDKIEAPGYGLEFDGTSPRDLARLDQFLKGLSPGSSSRSIHDVTTPSAPGH